MTNESDVKLREAFEAWARGQNLDCDTPHSNDHLVRFGNVITNPYGDERANFCFQAWQASSNHKDHLLQLAVEALKGTRKVLRHAAKVTTVQIRNNRRVQVLTVRAVQAEHELKRVEQTLLTLQQHIRKE